MIIFGTRGITTTPQRGEFHCPQCGDTRAYNWKRVRRFFTLYFIPVIPLDQLGEYIECPSCQGTFDTRVLEYDPSHEAIQIQALFHASIKQVMIGMLLADGVIDDSEVAMVLQIYNELTGSELPELELREEITQIQAQQIDCLELAKHLAPTLNDNGKEITMKAAYRIAAADGTVDPSEISLLMKIGQALQLSATHVKGIMSEFQQGAIAHQNPPQPPALQ
tara:strand:+ start:17552 stop:18214 length:663 start_codon:yes stop_codon:yes gene_type:complete